MARKKKEDNEKDKKKSPDDILFGEFAECITNADYLKGLRSEIVPVSPRFNIGLNGGVPEGSFVIISGKPGQGKSSLANHIAANAQSIPSKNGDRLVYYFDIEGRIKYKDLKGNQKLNISEDRFKLIQSKPGKILTGDQFIELAEKIINAHPGCICILDSLSSICTKARQEADIKDRFRDDANLLLSSFCKRISQVIPINQSIVIGICHLIADPGPSRSLWVEAGGNKIKFAADVKIMGTYYEPWKVGTNIVGQISHWKIDKSALGPPFGEVTSYIRYGYGFDDIAEIIELATDIGLIKKNGTWLLYNDDIKGQGLENFRNVLLEKNDIYLEIKNKVDALFKT